MGIRAEDWYGNSAAMVTLNDDTHVLSVNARCVLLFPNAATRTVTLPDPAALLAIGWDIVGGGRRAFVIGNPSTQDLVVNDHNGSPLGTIPGKKTSPEDRYHWGYVHLVNGVTIDYYLQLRTPAGT